MPSKAVGLGSHLSSSSSSPHLLQCPSMLDLLHRPNSLPHPSPRQAPPPPACQTHLCYPNTSLISSLDLHLANPALQMNDVVKPASHILSWRQFTMHISCSKVTGTYAWGLPTP